MTWARGVPHDTQGFGVLRRDQPQCNFAFVGQIRIRADDLAVDLRGHRRLGQPRADFRGDIDRADAAVVFLDRAVRQMDFEHDFRTFAGWAERSLVGESHHRDIALRGRRYKGRENRPGRKEVSILCLCGILQDPVDVCMSAYRNGTIKSSPN